MQKSGAVEATTGEVLHNFGEQMKAARGRAGMAQASLQDLLWDGFGIKLDTSGITRMEAGQREPRLSEALAIGAVLGLELSDLASGPRDLNRQLGNIAGLLSQARESVAALLQSADQLTEYAKENPDTLGGEKLENLVSQVIDRVRTEIHVPAKPTRKSSGAGDKLKRQLLAAITA